MWTALWSVWEELSVDNTFYLCALSWFSISVYSCLCRNAIAGHISALFLWKLMSIVTLVSVVWDNFITHPFVFFISVGGLLAVFTDVCCCLTRWCRGSPLACHWKSSLPPPAALSEHNPELPLHVWACLFSLWCFALFLHCPVRDPINLWYSFAEVCLAVSSEFVQRHKSQTKQ